ncbi:MAG: hypothetical protein P4L53_28525 [Candidatus Obscuribacterales bacterium]|nr:hypothetical protein [Candidatus Obscuribacterales bacterium]
MSNQILKDEIALHRLTIDFGVKNIVENIAKKRRQYIWDGGNSAATEAGLIVADHVFWGHSKYRSGLVAYQKPPFFLLGRVSKEVPGSQNAGQFYPQIIGQEFNAAGNVYELAFNAGWRLHRHNQQITSSQALLRARILLDQIDRNISSRKALLDSDGGLQAASDYASESEALQVLRNSLVKEFGSTYVLRLREFFGLNTVEIVDLFRNTIGAIGNQLSVRAGYTGNHHLNGLGNVLADISAVTITIKPFVLRKVLAFEEKRAKKELARKLGDVDDFSADLERLQQYRKSHFEKASFARRQNAIDHEIQILTKSRDEEHKNETRQTRIVRTETGRDLFTGPSKMVSSTLSVVAQYDSHINKNATERNRFAAAGNTTYTVGQAYNFAVLTSGYLAEEARYRRIKCLHDTPDERRLEQDRQLTEIERSLNGSPEQ